MRLAKNGVVEAAVPELARALGVSTRSARGAISELLSGGWLTVVGERSKGRLHTSFAIPASLFNPEAIHFNPEDSSGLDLPGFRVGGKGGSPVRNVQVQTESEAAAAAALLEGDSTRKLNPEAQPGSFRVASGFAEVLVRVPLERLDRLPALLAALGAGPVVARDTPVVHRDVKPENVLAPEGLEEAVAEELAQAVEHGKRVGKPVSRPSGLARKIRKDLLAEPWRVQGLVAAGRARANAERAREEARARSDQREAAAAAAREDEVTRQRDENRRMARGIA